MQALGGVVYELPRRHPFATQLPPPISVPALHAARQSFRTRKRSPPLRAQRPPRRTKKRTDFLRALAEVDGLPVDIEAPIPVTKPAPRPSTHAARPGTAPASPATASRVAAAHRSPSPRCSSPSSLIGGGLYYFVIPLFKKSPSNRDAEYQRPGNSDVKPEDNPPVRSAAFTIPPPKKNEPKTPPPPTQSRAVQHRLRRRGKF